MQTIKNGKISSIIDEINSNFDETVDDVRIYGTSIVTDGVANVPKASSSTLGVVRGGTVGIGINNDGQLFLSSASETFIKSGTNSSAPIVPNNQHISSFYGLAKAAGDSTQSASSNAVGTYTDDALIKIQKMLGIYEAPWELIREDEFILAEQGNIEIVVDDNGQPFELTDIRLLFQTPVQSTEAKVANYGRVKAYYSDSLFETMYINAYTQAAEGSAKTSIVSIEQKNGMIERKVIKNKTEGSDTEIMGPSRYTTSSLSMWEIASHTYTKVVVEAVTGTAKVKLYGRRKWN